MAERKAIRLGSVVRTNVSTYSEKEGWAFVNYLDTGNITQDTISEIQRINVGTDKLPGMSANPTITGNLLIHTFHCRLKSHSWKRFWDYDTFLV